MAIRTVFRCLVLLSGLGLSACYSGNGTFDPIGRWSSKEGYNVTLRTNGTYQFCDREWCSEGKVDRPGGPNGFAVTLVGFFKKENSVRIAQYLKKLGFYNLPVEKPEDFDFSVNSGISTAGPSKFCDYKPCVLFGNLETGPNLVFTKNTQK